MADRAREWSEIDRLVGAMWRMSSPGALLHNAWVAYHYHGTVLHCEKLGLTEVTADPAALARDADYLAWLQPRLAAHEGFVALRRHHAALGVRGEFVGHDGYGGDATSWGVIVPRDSLPRLERLAQDAAGLTSRSARKAAARDFRTYMARQYAPDYQENRKSLPPVDESPYRLVEA